MVIYNTDINTILNIRMHWEVSRIYFLLKNNETVLRPYSTKNWLIFTWKESNFQNPSLQFNKNTKKLLLKPHWSVSCRNDFHGKINRKLSSWKINRNEKIVITSHNASGPTRFLVSNLAIIKLRFFSSSKREKFWFRTKRV